jgi:hypothetical protein
MGCSGVFVGIVVVVFLEGGVACWRPADGEATREVVGRWGPRHTHLARGAPERSADGQGGRQRAMRSIKASLDKILAFRLSDEGLELCGGESIYQTSFGHDEEQDLSAG